MVKFFHYGQIVMILTVLDANNLDLFQKNEINFPHLKNSNDKKPMWLKFLFLGKFFNSFFQIREFIY
jgi:hypothetical protein